MPSFRFDILTCLLIGSFIAVTVAYVLSMFQSIHGINTRAFDPGATASYFGTILTAFIAHHFVSSKYPKDPT